MKYEIVTKDKEGNIVFQGTATKNEASFILEVGVNYLLANGAMPLLTGNREDESKPNVVSGTGSVQ